MRLLAETLAVLARYDLPFAIVGATAMAAHGVARATLDVDLLVPGRAALDSPAWSELRESGASVEIRKGEADDPLDGVVRLRRTGESPIDIIVGSWTWQRRAIERASVVRVLGVEAPVVSAVDLVLLKLYAGSPQDCWDVARLLSSAPLAGLRERVDEEVEDLPAECRVLWKSIRKDISA